MGSYCSLPIPPKIDKDPNDLDVGTPGAKMDQGKVQADLLRYFSRALLAVAEVSTYGTMVKGYARGGWQKVEDGIARYDGAKWRHLLEEEIQPLDSESQLLHAKHEAWNTLARLELMLRDDPPIPQEKVIPGRSVRIYLSHPIRGIQGYKATPEYIAENNQLAREAGAILRSHGHIVYIPAEHEEFIGLAYGIELSEKDILDVDCRIIDTYDEVFFFKHEGTYSRGMMIEEAHACRTSKPQCVASDLQGVERMAKQLAEGIDV